ncbi:hypothetical protein Tco_1424031 [Tanacetum coccineum]
MLANNNNQDIAEVIRAFANNKEATKKRKREDNLRTWKWSDVIDVDNLPDNVPKPEETTSEQHVVASMNNNVIGLTLQEHEIDDEDIPLAPFKRKKKDQIKITGRTRLCRLFDEDASDHEEDLREDASDQEKDLDEDASDQEEDSDDGIQRKYTREVIDEGDGKILILLKIRRQNPVFIFTGSTTLIPKTAIEVPLSTIHEVHAPNMAPSKDGFENVVVQKKCETTTTIKDTFEGSPSRTTMTNEDNPSDSATSHAYNDTVYVRSEALKEADTKVFDTKEVVMMEVDMKECDMRQVDVKEVIHEEDTKESLVKKDNMKQVDVKEAVMDEEDTKEPYVKKDDIKESQI